MTGALLSYHCSDIAVSGRFGNRFPYTLLAHRLFRQSGNFPEIFRGDPHERANIRRVDIKAAIFTYATEVLSVDQNLGPSARYLQSYHYFLPILSYRWDCYTS
ncbi:MAG TPA: hypothetical protein VMA75_00905 [Candidatus Paceibacterota bacterium]|nr:hypothetical protein [Candidatus Paceibacterota bacterium]